LLEALARLKVVEEALELAAGGTPWEAGDVLEALRYWAEVSGWGWGAVEEAARAKRAAAGGFEGHAALGPCRAAAMSLGVPGYAISPRRALLRRVVRAG
ncbi:MAG: hypothetical protein LRS49_04275, partial [Desulfurococcales archaeon]|nr:hypothetical protein [Desulfurococcales archaeon]